MDSSSSSQDRDNQLLEVGKQCSDPSCLLVDFLPFKCHHCELSFCQDHFKVDAHKCPKYDESKYNRVAPNCMPDPIGTIIYIFTHMAFSIRPALQHPSRSSARSRPECSYGHTLGERVLRCNGQSQVEVNPHLRKRQV